MNKRLRCTVSETTHDRIIELAQRLELEPRQVVERAVREYWESHTRYTLTDQGYQLAKSLNAADPGGERQ